MFNVESECRQETDWNVSVPGGQNIASRRSQNVVLYCCSYLRGRVRPNDIFNFTRFLQLHILAHFHLQGGTFEHGHGQWLLSPTFRLINLSGWFRYGRVGVSGHVQIKSNQWWWFYSFAPFKRQRMSNCHQCKISALEPFSIKMGDVSKWPKLMIKCDPSSISQENANQIVCAAKTCLPGRCLQSAMVFKWSLNTSPCKMPPCALCSIILDFV